MAGVEFPANVNGVIAVGAIDYRGIIKNYSSRGIHLGLVAPSGVSTTDRMGLHGYESGNYFHNFIGTSASAPHVSGVAALVLSVNPNLTETQVRTILLQTATDLGDYGFDNTHGHGLVNAYAAVRKAQVICADVVVEFRDVTLGRSGTIRTCGSINVENVTVTNNARLTLDAPGTVRLGPGFRVEAGASLRVKPE